MAAHFHPSATLRSSSASQTRVVAQEEKQRCRNDRKAVAAQVWGSVFGVGMAQIFCPAQPVSQPSKRAIFSIGGAQ